MRLADRGKHPPGGFRYYVPQTNWSITPWVAFDVAVAEIINHRLGNPYISSQNGWSTDPAVVAGELDAFNTAVCQQMRWNAYITEGTPTDPPPPPPPFTIPRSPSLAKSAAAAVGGIKTIVQWEISGGKVVEPLLADKRAQICADCPKNVQGGLLDFFTEAAASLIKRQLESRNQMKLSTPSDDRLGICEACGCVNKLSVFCPLEIKVSHLSEQVKAQLDPKCWCLNEPR